MSSLTDLTDALLPSIRAKAAAVANDTRTGPQIIFTSRPDPTTQLPYGVLTAIGEPDAGVPGESVTQLQLSAWGPYYQLSELADALEPLDGYTQSVQGGLRGIRCRRLSRNVVADPDAEGVHQMVDLYEARYLSLPRMEAAMI